MVTSQPQGDQPFIDASVIVLGIYSSEATAVQSVAIASPGEVIQAGDQLVLSGPLKSLALLRSDKR